MALSCLYMAFTVSSVSTPAEKNLGTPTSNFFTPVRPWYLPLPNICINDPSFFWLTQFFKQHGYGILDHEQKKAP